MQRRGVMERDAVWWRETTTVGRKERRRRYASGKPGFQTTWQRIGSRVSTVLQRPLSAAAGTALFVHLQYYVCVKESERHSVKVGNKCLRVRACVRACNLPRCSLTFLKYSASRPPDALPVWPCVNVTDWREMLWNVAAAVAACHTEVTHTQMHLQGWCAHSYRCQWRCLERRLGQGLIWIQGINKHQHRKHTLMIWVLSSGQSWV